MTKGAPAGEAALSDYSPPPAGSFVPPPVIAQLLDLTRYRKKLIEDRTKEVQRVHKTLEHAGIKLESVVTGVMGKAARRMIEALIARERDPEVLAQMALTQMRPRIPSCVWRWWAGSTRTMRSCSSPPVAHRLPGRPDRGHGRRGGASGRPAR